PVEPPVLAPPLPVLPPVAVTPPDPVLPPVAAPPVPEVVSPPLPVEPPVLVVPPVLVLPPVPDVVCDPPEPDPPVPVGTVGAVLEQLAPKRRSAAVDARSVDFIGASVSEKRSVSGLLSGRCGFWI